MEDNINLYREPINIVIDKIKSSNKDVVFLMGPTGSGKTTVLKNFAREDVKNNPIIDASIKMGEYINTYDYDLFKTYNICLIIKKMYNYFNNVYGENSLKNLLYFNLYIDNIMESIKIMFLTNEYKNKEKFINQHILLHPEILLDEFLTQIKVMNFDKITVIVDNFDSIRSSSIFYQETIYNLLKRRVKLVATISDNEVINNESSKELIIKKNDIVKVDYCYNYNDVKNILQKELINLARFYNRSILFYLIDTILPRNVIEEMILRTNGNIDNMLTSLRVLYAKIDELDQEQYGPFILNYIDEVINKDPLITGYIKPVRKLHLKNLHLS